MENGFIGLEIVVLIVFLRCENEGEIVIDLRFMKFIFVKGDFSIDILIKV